MNIIAVYFFNDATVRCWGKTWLSQIGSAAGTKVNEMSQLEKQDLAGYLPRRIYGTYDNLCAVVDDPNTPEREKLLRCWGQNFFGALGIENSSDPSISSKDTSIIKLGHEGSLDYEIVDIDIGQRNICAIIKYTSSNDDDPKLKCWGANTDSTTGQAHISGNDKIGDDLNEIKDLPVLNFDKNDNTNYIPTKIILGNFHSTVILMINTVVG